MADVTSCREAEELLALAALGVLEPAHAGQLERHLAGCSRCTRTAVDFRRAAAMLSDSLEPVKPPRELRRRLMAAVYASSGRPAPRRPLWRAAWERIPQGRAFSAAAAVALVAAVVLATWGATRGAPPRPLTYAVVPTASDPSVHGQLIYYADTSRSVLTVSGLSANANSGVVEVWLVPRSGDPIPAAFLTPVPYSGSWTAAISGDVRSYKTVAATSEPPGGRPLPTGPQLFSVDLSS